MTTKEREALKKIILQLASMQVPHRASEAFQEAQTPQEDARNAQPILELKQQVLVANALVLYPKQEQSFGQIEVFALARDSLEAQLHPELSENLQLVLTAPLIARATWT